MADRTTQHVTRLRRHGIRFQLSRPGTMPGSLEPAAQAQGTTPPPAQVSLIRYGASGDVEQQTAIAADQCQAPASDASGVTWVHLQGSPGAEQLKILGKNFSLHALALEDILNHEARPKLEAYEHHQFMVLDFVRRNPDSGLNTEQISLFLGKNYVISIHDGATDVFEPVRQRIRGMARIRAHGADYLFYALVDLIVDSGFPLLEELGDRLENLEDEILDSPNRQSRNKIHYIKRELILARRAWWPQREVLSRLMRDNELFISSAIHPYLRDCYDHCVIVIDFVETYREMTSSLLDTYLSAVSQRMNDVMKALTIIATIFLPLSFIAGLYGMNFDTASHWNMPELHWRFGYFYALGVMAAIALGMITWFRHKRWL